MNSAILENIKPGLGPDDREFLAAPITQAELDAELKRSPKNKSPGSDGLPAEFYLQTWDVIGPTVLDVLNTALQRGRLPDSLLTGIMVLLPKVSKPSTVKDFRPLTMLNADYKLLARVLTARMTAVAHKVLHPMVVQPGGERNITAALADLRDAVAFFDHTQSPGCLLSADIVGAFNHVRHDFLFEVMRRMGFGEEFVNMIRTMYTGTTTRIQVNGFLSTAIRVLQSVRQGCPKSAIIFAFVMSPFIDFLSSRLRGLEVGEIKFRASAYADDVTAVLTSMNDVRVVRDAFAEYEAVSGLAVSSQKTRAIALGTWDPAEHPLLYSYVDHCRILGVIFAKDIPTMAEKSWSSVLAAANAVLNANWFRSLNLIQKAWFVSTYVLSKLWYVAQVLPIPEADATQLQRLVARWLWAGSTFSVPFRLLCAPRTAGGLGLLHPRWKALSLFMGRWTSAVLLLRHTFSAAYLEVLSEMWPLHDAEASRDIPASLSHYVEYHRRRPAGLQADPPLSARATHRTIYSLLLAADPPAPPRAERLATRDVDWPVVWKSISRSWHGSATRSWWYMAVHDLVRTRFREHHDIDRNKAVRTPPTCVHCGALDTPQHRLVDCGPAADVWRWLTRVLGRLPKDVLIRPDRKWKPPQLHATMTWALGKVVRYVLESRQAERSLQGFRLFLQHALAALSDDEQRRFGPYLARLSTALQAP